MIKTKKIKLTQGKILNILLVRFIKKHWWVLAWIWGMATIMWMKILHDSVDYFFFVMAIVYPILLLSWQFLSYLNSKENKLLLSERHYEIDDEKINGVIGQAAYSPIKLDRFTKVDVIRNAYLLYMPKKKFIYIPNNSFKNKTDEEWFKKEIISKIKQ